MKNSKALILLSTCSNDELRALKSYLAKQFSPKKLAFRIFLFYQSKKKILAEKEELLDLPIAYQKICKKALTKEGRKVFLNALHTLNKAVQQFLLMKELEKDSFEKDQLLIKIYQERKLGKLVTQTIEKKIKKIEDNERINQWQPLQLMQLYHHSYYENYENQFRNQKNILKKLMENLDKFYCNMKMYYACELNNKVHFKNQYSTILFQKEITVFINSKEYPKQQLAYLYFLCLELNIKETITQFLTLKTYFEKFQHLFSVKDQYFVTTIMASYLFRRRRKGNKKYTNLLFEIKKNGMESGLFFYDGQLLQNDFNNMVTIACLVEQFKWAKIFIRDYQHYIPDSLRVSTVHLARAYVCFSEGNFEQVLIELNNVEYSNISLELRARGLIIRTYYELGENKNLILDYSNAFKHYLQNNQQVQQMPQMYRDNYLLLIKYITIFVKIDNRKSKKEIIEKINNEKSKQFQKWLLEKANQLNK